MKLSEIFPPSARRLRLDGARPAFASPTDAGRLPHSLVATPAPRRDIDWFRGEYDPLDEMPERMQRERDGGMVAGALTAAALAGGLLGFLAGLATSAILSAVL